MNHWFIHCIIREPLRLTSTLIPYTRMMAHLEQVMETSYSCTQGIKKAFVWEYTTVSIMALSRINYTTYLHHIFSSCIPHPIIFINCPLCGTSNPTPCTCCRSLQDGCSNSSEPSVTIHQLTCHNIRKIWIFISTTVRTTNPRNMIRALNYQYQPTDSTNCPSFPKEF